ncbi:MAG: DUF1846 family protein [Candidatus Diapherotrites archaeon]|nr:DUF1846 family protein [Candidatus Diapherotrites archaeon]
MVKEKQLNSQKKGFDNEKYLKAQTKAILNRVAKFDKLYLELGGRLTFDGHASRVLPGYNPKNKIRLLKRLGKKAGLLYCISSIELEKEMNSGSKWSNTGLSIDELALKEINELEKNKIEVLGIVATRFSGQKSVLKFKKRLARHGKKLFFTKTIHEYPNNLKKIFGPRGFSAQGFIPTMGKKVVVVSGAGANSGKMFTCLSQIYHEEKKGVSAGFAKSETFPIWNLPINHEVNIAYEASTADIGDKIMVDPYHKRAYNITAVNYNRDIENFYILKRSIQRLCPKENYMHSYQSPTDMGVNMAKIGIIHNNVCREAGRAEILRRYEFYSSNLKGEKRSSTLKRMKIVLKKIGFVNL